MTNRQWLAGLLDRELIEFMLSFNEMRCEHCEIDVDDDCEDDKCIDGMVAWLQDDHEEVR